MSEQDYLFELKCLQRSTARKRFRKDIFEAWNGCAYCGRTNPSTLDHVVPKSKGGSTCRTNLVASCACCNLAKSDLPWFAWFREQDFWDRDRELKILEWVNHSHDNVESAKHYLTLCETPLIEPALTA